MSNKRFELIIICGGAAGFAAATRADELKIKTAITMGLRRNVKRGSSHL